MPSNYDAKSIEPEILAFWKSHQIYSKAKEKTKGKRSFYFIDGPPYTTGAIHIGHAWNKALKDSILRYKRMKGFDVWAQPGFDMHGLPIEIAVEKKLGIKDKNEIFEKIGVQKFIDECEKFSVEQMHPMITDFERMGVWMDFERPYMTIKNEYIEGAWWALSEANKNGFLYEGKKSMTWCPRCATALAKHELNYKDLNDKTIYVKFPVENEDNTFLVIWTTTPWTLPFNLAVMAHPDIEYSRCHVKETDENWIIASGLAKTVIETIAGKTFEVIETFKGSELEGKKYQTPFYDEFKFHQQASKEHKKAHTVVMSSEYVDLSAGTGLVHTAPGCGPEDFEVGKRNGLPAYNTLDDHGKFTEGMVGLVAKKDDDQFIAAIDKKGLLAMQTTITHEYPCCWRCDTPVIYRATEQWFLGVEKLKNKMIENNEKVQWVPDWAGNRWFNSWLENLQDWCISRQRFWGIPLPIWKCTSCKETKIIGTRKELPSEIENLHRPAIDEITFTCKCGSQMRRTPDVLDVWMDSGAASWAPLGYPMHKKEFEHRWPANLILEGKDQIRGWFNSMSCLSTVSHQKNPYNAVYMHGFVNDALGRKMSKSLKNTISPYEVIDSYGADTLRYYTIGGAKPGFDLNYNFDDMKIKHKNLTVIWNVHNYLLELKKTADLEGEKEIGAEENYILSKMHSTIQKSTYMFDNYYLSDTPWIIEELFLELSRTYIQLTREKSNGTEIERNTVLHTIYTVFFEGLKMLAPIAPFISEQIYQNLKKEFDLPLESIHLMEWPTADQSLIDERLEDEFSAAKGAIQAILSAREKIRSGIRWPLQEAIIVTNQIKSPEILSAIARQTNIKTLKTVGEFKTKVDLKADFNKLKDEFGGQKATRIIAAIAMTGSETILRYIEKDGEFHLSLDNEKVTLTQSHFLISKLAPHGYEYATFEKGEVYVNIITNPQLEAEGYARELMRRLQSMRKNCGLEKSQSIDLHIHAPVALVEMLKDHQEAIKAKVGAAKITIESTEPKQKYDNKSTEKVRDFESQLSFSLI